MLEFLSALFCGKQREEIRKLELGYDYVQTTLHTCKQERQELLQQFLTCTKEKIQQNLDHQEQVSQLNEEVHRLRNIEILLDAALAKAVVVPDISDIIDEDSLMTIMPYNEPQYRDYELHFADWGYHVFPHDVWMQILSKVHVEIEKVLISWVTDISDCDNWSFSTADVTSLAFKKATLNKQGAFPVIWSHTHAYNGFITDTFETYIYEPQNNTVIGKLGETTEPYDSQIIWFPQ